MIERAMVTREGDSGLSVLEQMEVHRRAVTDSACVRGVPCLACDGHSLVMDAFRC